ncbi:hypothetical protein FE783_23560 [Paenibacillus mesophilus]|uniref:PP2C family protein-serine/threonine phosphatase n=1 Tax=Paenibacillus mesophilus TaxID=2582849 RepID=UPI00110D27F7|nr:SpoIIE family protein phosphatase [Paenibacillus mesophilus]TMV47215.1 hypothetical protein FE783_23560 [Paenibacillus mesophilus]
MTGNARRLYARLVAVYTTVSFVAASAMVLSNWYVSGYSADRIIGSGIFIFVAFFLWILLASGYTRNRLKAVEKEVNGGADSPLLRSNRLPLWTHLIKLPENIFWLFLAVGTMFAQVRQIYVLVAVDDPSRWLHYIKSTLFNVTAISGVAFVYYGILRSMLRSSLPVLSGEEARSLRFTSLLRPLTIAFVCAVIFPLLRIVWNAAEDQLNGRTFSDVSLVSIAVIAGAISFVAYAILSFSFLRELRDMIAKLRQAVAAKPGGMQEPIPIVSRYESGRLAAVNNELQYRKVSEYDRLEKERRLAAGVQRLIMRRGEVVLGRWRMRGELREGEEIGGHFYDLVQIGHGRLVFAVGMVSGDGMPAALVLSAFVGMLRSEARDGSIADIAVRLNANLWRTLRGKHTISVIMGILDHDDGHIEMLGTDTWGLTDGARPSGTSGGGGASALGLTASAVFRTERLVAEPGRNIRLAVDHSGEGATLWLSLDCNEREGAM